MKRKAFIATSILVILLLTIVGCSLFGAKEEEPVARSYQTNCYTEQGGSKIVCTDGGSIELQSGAALWVTPGATVSLGNVTLGAISGENLALAVPAAQTTATPGADINMVAAGSAAILIRDAATPVAEWLQTGALSVDTIGEFTGANGVVVDSLTIKDGGVTGDLPITANADQHQLVVTGYTTQTNNLLVLEQSGGADSFTVANSGNTDISGTLQYGTDDLYPLGYASSGEQIVCGSETITGTATLAHGLTTPSYVVISLGDDPSAGANEGFIVSFTISGSTVTGKVWQDDASAATVGETVHWCVVGTP